MKRILPILILSVFCTVGAQAQLIKDADDKLDKMVLAFDLTGPEMLSFEMKQELKLSAEQLAQVVILNELRYKHIAEAEAIYPDPLKRQRKFRDIHLQLDRELSSILDEQQLKHFLELEGRQNVRYLSGTEEE
jgi:hypothetical protein